MLEITLTQFTPAQAEKITGVAVDQQRNLRRHGYLPSTEGHARFDVYGLARLLAIKALSDRGIGPSLTATPESGFDIASLCAAGMLWDILEWQASYEGDHETFALDGPPPVPTGPAGKELLNRTLEALRDQGRDTTRFEALISAPTGWGDRQNILKKMIFAQLGLPRAIPARFFVWFADGSHRWEAEIEEAFVVQQNSRQLQGAVMVVDQWAMATVLREKSATAFAHVEERP